MNPSGCAEWLLARRFGSQRANEITGDLLEQYKPSRAILEMYRLAFSLRSFEFMSLLLVSLALTLVQHALFSAWPLRFMETVQDTYTGWPWTMCSSLGLAALTSWLVTASSVVGLGMHRRLTRCSLVFSCTLSLLSCFMLQPDLRRFSPALLLAVLISCIWVLGSATAIRCLGATCVLFCTLWRLFASTVRTGEIHACVVQLRSRPQPTQMTYYATCPGWATHMWSITFLGTLLAFWLMRFLPPGESRGVEQKT